MGSLTIGGEGVAFGALAGTKMACPEPLMAVEQRWLEMLQTVTRFDIDAEGALILHALDDAVARLVR
jgi:heat shock protein HslJ